ncbi:hypothetical protein QCA50_016390 [Cerrena zonata]|uniref:Uncharacterized protein n=1 Tax=Cerrena zonata TaxID=2478898 RepID=A0AAW0FHM6_9APHY
MFLVQSRGGRITRINMAGACPCVLSTTLPYIPQLDKKTTLFLRSENSARIELSLLTQMQVLQCSYHLPILSCRKYLRTTVEVKIFVPAIAIWLNRCIRWSTWL